MQDPPTEQEPDWRQPEKSLMKANTQQHLREMLEKTRGLCRRHLIPNICAGGLHWPGKHGHMMIFVHVGESVLGCALNERQRESMPAQIFGFQCIHRMCFRLRISEAPTRKISDKNRPCKGNRRIPNRIAHYHAAFADWCRATLLLHLQERSIVTMQEDWHDRQTHPSTFLDLRATHA